MGAVALLLWNSSDIKRLKQLITVTFPSEQFLNQLYQRLYRYFDIAYGDGEWGRYHFNLINFVKEYKEYAPSVYWGIKYLEREGILEMTEELEVLSSISIKVSREQLYSIQLSNLKLDSFIKALMRLYEGLFSGYVSIKEEYIARATRNSKEGVEELLVRLKRMGVIGYKKGAYTRLIKFNQPREREEYFTISKERYNTLKKDFSDKIEGVISFVSEGEICRSGRLMEYLGQSEWNDCNICDVCRARMASGNYRERFIEVERALMEVLQSWPYTLEGNPYLEQLSELLPQYQGEWQEVLRDLLDRGEVLLTDDRVELIKKKG